GNSLIGATPELVSSGLSDGAFDPVAGDDKTSASAAKRRNREERRSQLSSGPDRAPWDAARSALAQAARAIDDLSADTHEQVLRQRDAYAVYREDVVDPRRAPLDIWTAAFFWPLTRHAPLPPTVSNARSSPARLSESQSEQLAI